ncbi:hypothetical protein H7X87_03975 [Acetobacteraceae bacterium]|nr:hypothetical protein [Candidatus Parcubacteria bacterium]
MKRHITHIAIPYTPLLNRLALVMCACIVLSLFLYGIFLLQAVVHTAGRATAERRIDALATKTSALEVQYLAKTKELTPARAQALGFVPPASASVIYATAASRSLGYNSLHGTQ